MSIGATLAAARRHAGLSLAEVSQRTRVRENIVQGIEQDHYAGCGGDFYARGHIRAIAEAVGTDPAPLIEEFDERWRSSPEITAAEVFQPSIPLRKRERRRVRWTAALAVVVLAVLGFAGFKFASGVGKTQNAAAVTSQHPAHGGQPATAPSVTPSVQASTAQPSPTATSPASPVPVQALIPASVAAFGPAGTADGDDPHGASSLLAGSPAGAWSSDWYRTSDFGHLQAGTGLLLDMGRTVAISSVRLELGGRPGAELQLRAGSRPVLADLPRVATSAGGGGPLTLQLSTPVHARYVLIWFTKLPPDPAGTYQVSVLRIRVLGHR